MNWLNHWLIECYLNPAGSYYQVIQFINRYPCRLICTIFILAILFPAIKLGYVYYQNHHIQMNLVEDQELLINKQKLLKSIEQHQISQYQKSQQFAEFDLNIKEILQNHKVEIEYLQWYFEPNKRIEIGLNGQSVAIFNVLKQLHQINGLFAQEITLLKLYQDRKIQMNASFIIQE